MVAKGGDELAPADRVLWFDVRIHKRWGSKCCISDKWHQEGVPDAADFKGDSRGSAGHGS